MSWASLLPDYINLQKLPPDHPAPLKKPRNLYDFAALRDPAGTRTQDPLIKSQMLYRLSYRIDPFHGQNGKDNGLRRGVQCPF